MRISGDFAFLFVTLTTVVAEADERFGKAYLRWARPVAISEINPDLREIQEGSEITKLQLFSLHS